MPFAISYNLTSSNCHIGGTDTVQFDLHDQSSLVDDNCNVITIATCNEHNESTWFASSDEERNSITGAAKTCVISEEFGKAGVLRDGDIASSSDACSNVQGLRRSKSHRDQR